MNEESIEHCNGLSCTQYRPSNSGGACGCGCPQCTSLSAHMRPSRNRGNPLSPPAMKATESTFAIRKGAYWLQGESNQTSSGGWGTLETANRYSLDVALFTLKDLRPNAFCEVWRVQGNLPLEYAGCEVPVTKLRQEIIKITVNHAGTPIANELLDLDRWLDTLKIDVRVSAHIFYEEARKTKPIVESIAEMREKLSNTGIQQ